MVDVITTSALSEVSDFWRNMRVVLNLPARA
jgi:hypothetical protein